MAPQDGWSAYRNTLEAHRIACRIVFASEVSPGLPLTTILARAKDWSVVADLSAALFAMRRLLSIADGLQRATGDRSFAISGERVVVTARGSLLILEPDRETFEARAEGADGARMDIAEIAIAGVSLVAGRAVDAIEASDPQSPILKEMRDATAIRVDMTFAGALHEWLDRALAADPRSGFADYQAARTALDDLHPPKGSGCRPSRRMLKSFLGDLQLTEFASPKLSVVEIERGRALRRTIVAGRPRHAAMDHDDDSWAALDFSDSPEPQSAPPSSPPVRHEEPPALDESSVEFEEYKPADIPGSFQLPELEPESEPEESSIFTRPTDYLSQQEPQPESPSPFSTPSPFEAAPPSAAEPESESESVWGAPSPFYSEPEPPPAPAPTEDANSWMAAEAPPQSEAPSDEPGPFSWGSSEARESVDPIEAAPPPPPPPPPPRRVEAAPPPPPPPPPPPEEPQKDDKDWFKPVTPEVPTPSDDDKDWFKSGTQQQAAPADNDKDWFNTSSEPATESETEEEGEEESAAAREEQWFPDRAQQLHEVVPPADIPPAPVVPPPESAGWDKRVAPLREEADLSAPEPELDAGPATIVHGAGASIIDRPYMPPEPVEEEEPPKPRRERRPIHIETPSAGRAIGTALVTASIAGALIAGALYFTHRATPGTITFETKPIGLELLQDGAIKGKTPVTLVLSPGTYEFSLRRGKTTKPFHIVVKEGSHETQKVDFTALRPVGTLIVKTDPPGAKITLDGKNRGVTPQTLTDVPIGSHTVILDGEQGTLRRQVNIEEQETATISEAIFPGFLKVDASFDVKILEGGRVIGTSDGQISLRAGSHKIELVNEDQGYHDTKTIDISPGEIKRILAK